MNVIWCGGDRPTFQLFLVSQQHKASHFISPIFDSMSAQVFDVMCNLGITQPVSAVLHVSSETTIPTSLSYNNASSDMHG